MDRKFALFGRSVGVDCVPAVGGKEYPTSKNPQKSPKNPPKILLLSLDVGIIFYADFILASEEHSTSNLHLLTSFTLEQCINKITDVFENLDSSA